MFIAFFFSIKAGYKIIYSCYSSNLFLLWLFGETHSRIDYKLNVSKWLYLVVGNFISLKLSNMNKRTNIL